MDGDKLLDFADSIAEAMVAAQRNAVKVIIRPESASAHTRKTE